mgnify:CR=1 FL=1
MPFLSRLLLTLLLMALPWVARAKDSLIIGISQYPATLHPATEAMMAKSYVLGAALRPLTAYDSHWRLVCMLCETLPTLENGLARRETTADGKDGIALRYTLPASSFWADGTPVTSADALFTWDAGRHPKSGFANAEMYRRIVRLEVVDAKTFIIHLDRVTFDYNALNDFVLLPAHIERERFFADPAQYRTHTAYDQDSTNPGLYNGPYRISETVQGSHVTLEPNPSWQGPRPAFKRVVVRVVENSAALEAQLLSGGIDMIAGELGVTLDQAQALAKRKDRRFHIVYNPGLVFEHLDINHASPILADRRVRQALLYGLDRSAINRDLFGGHQPVATTSVNPLDRVYTTDNVALYPYDPAKAARLLDEAGWTMTKSGRINTKGEPLTLELVTTAGSRARELVAQVIQSQWRRLGIDLKLRTEPPRVFFADTVSKRHYPHLALFAWVSAPEGVPRTVLHSDQIPSEANSWSGQNYAGYANPAMDKLLDATERELNDSKRQALWRQIQQLYAEDLPALPLFFRAEAHILPAGLSGLEPTGHQNPSTLWIENWRWPR